jgi:hypothetical protein
MMRHLLLWVKQQSDFPEMETKRFALQIALVRSVSGKEKGEYFTPPFCHQVQKKIYTL